MKVQITTDDGHIFKTVDIISDEDLLFLRKVEVLGPIIDTENGLRDIERGLFEMAFAVQKGELL